MPTTDNEIIADQVLFIRMKDRDEQAFEMLYQRYWVMLYTYTRKFVADSGEAEDIVQEVFVALWKNSGKVVIRTSLANYLYGCTRFKIFDYIDKQEVRTRYAASQPLAIGASHYVTDNAIRERELISLIESSINALPPKMREVFVLSRKADFSHQEIADQLQISPQTVKKQMHNALKLLRLKLSHFLSLILFL